MAEAILAEIVKQNVQEGIRGPLQTEGGRPDGEASRGDVE